MVTPNSTQIDTQGYFPYGLDSVTDTVKQRHPFNTLNTLDREDIENFHQAPNPKLKQISTSGEDDEKSIAKDIAYAKATTCRNFLHRLTGKSKSIFESLFNNNEFIRHIMSNKVDPYTIPEELHTDISQITSPVFLKLLYELNMRLHIEHGDHILDIYLDDNDKQYRLTRSESPDLHHPELDYPLISSDITEQDIENFKQINSGKANYRNTYAQSIPAVAMITHNRAAAVTNVCEFMNNMIRYGHTQRTKPIPFLVIDDSNDDLKETRYQQFKEQAAIYKDHNIDLKLITETQKQKLIEFLLQKINIELPEEDTRKLVEAALGNDGGPGAQRNWAILFGAITLDDDVHPYCYLNFADELRAMPVDFLGIMARSLAHSDTHSASFAYVGKSGAPFDDMISRFFQIADNEDYSSHSDYGESLIDDETELHISQPNYNPDGISGGIQTLASAIHGDDIDLPFIPTAEQYLRIDDHVAVFIGQALSQAFATRSRFHSPAGGIYHTIEKPQITESIIRQGILEPFSVTVFEKSFLSMFQALISDPNKNKADLISRVGNFILKTLDSYMNKILSMISTLPTPDSDHNEAFDGWFALLKANEDSSSSPPKREVCEMIRKAFTDFGLVEFYDNEYKTKDTPDWSKLDFSKLIDILKIEMKRYAQAMVIWPSLVETAREHRQELLNLLSA